MELVEFLDKGGGLIGLIGLEFRKVIVNLKGGIPNLDDANADVGAVVGYPLTVGENIGEHQTRADGAFAVLEPPDVRLRISVVRSSMTSSRGSTWPAS